MAHWTARLGFVALLGLVLTGCWVDLDVVVDLENDGTGEVSAEVYLSRNIEGSLDPADLWASGWELESDEPTFREVVGSEASETGAAGESGTGEVSRVLTLTKQFSSAEHLKQILEGELGMGLQNISLDRQVRGTTIDYRLSGEINLANTSFDMTGLERPPRVSLTADLPGADAPVVLVESVALIASTSDGTEDITGESSAEFATLPFEVSSSQTDSSPRIWQWVKYAAFALFGFVLLVSLVGFIFERRLRRKRKSVSKESVSKEAGEAAEPQLDFASASETEPETKTEPEAATDEETEPETEATEETKIAEDPTETPALDTQENIKVAELNSFKLSSGTDAVSCIMDGAQRGLVIIPDVMGLRELFEEHTLRLATQNNWNVACFELYGDNPDFTFEQRFEHVGELDDERVFADAIEAADLITQDLDIPCGIIGFCMGGMYVNKSPKTQRFDRAVSFYGMIQVPDDWQSPTQGEPLEFLAEGDASSLLAIIGEDDHYTPPDQVAELKEADVNIASYPGCEHGFVHDPNRDAHKPEEADDAWRTAIKFLNAES